MTSVVEALPVVEPSAASILDRPGGLELIRELARSEGLRIRIRGGCMQPVLEPDEMVRVRARRLYLPGDLLVVRAAAGLVVHRFLGYHPRRSGVQVWTRADDGSRPDAALPLGNVVGRVEERAAGVVRVPLRHRARAVAWFVTAALGGLGRRVVRRAGARP